VTLYDWTRFWCRPDATVHYDESGFVLDPEGDEWSRAFNPDLRRFDEIEAHQCLVLLGEPGIGKSFALERERLAIQQHVEGRDLVLPFDLRFAESLSALELRLFGSNAFDEWQQSRKHLHLFLDSLDEGMVEVAQLGAFLLTKLSAVDRSRLSLRLACRTADWRLSLEEALAGLWGEHEFAVFELVQLRRRDVEAAATAEGLEGERFSASVEERGLVPLAVKPVTLRFLLRDFAQSGTFSGSLAELYRSGCLQLCEEPDEERRHEARLSAIERLAIAERLAAVTVYGGRDVFWNGSESDAPSGATRVSEVSGGQEWTDLDLVAVAVPIEIGEAAVRETLATGLFTSRGGGQLGWAHQSYAEFLASRYVARTFGERATQFLSQVGLREGRIVPQLHAAAAWLASLDGQVRHFILGISPEALLGADLSLATSEERARLVEGLLALAARDGIVDFPRNVLAKLQHEGLAEQLRRVICATNRPVEERGLAIDIAELHELRELADELAGLALANEETYTLRTHAAFAVAQLGDDGAANSLRPLLEQTSDDPSDDLRGATLMALWPTGLNAQELIAALSPPKRRNYIGTYTMFLSRQEFADISADELAVLIDWAGDQPGEARRGAFDDFIDRLIAAGLLRVDEPQIGHALAGSVAKLLARDHALVAGGRKKEVAQALEQPSARRQLIELLVPRLVSGGLKTSDLTFSEPSLLSDEDIPWLVDKLEEAPESLQPYWATLVEEAFLPSASRHVEIVLEAAERNAALRARLARVVEPIRLDSQLAAQLREGFQRSRQFEAERTRVKPVRPVPAVESRLDEFVGGDLDAWWLLSMELALEGKAEPNELESDTTATQSWQTASDELRERLLASALAYLQQADPAAEDWFGTDKFHRPAAAGYRSLRLLLEVAPERLEQLTGDDWARWVPIVVAYPAYGGSEGTAQRRIVAAAYERAGHAARSWLVRMIEVEDNKGHEPFVLRRFDDVWDDSLEANLGELVVDHTLSPSGTAAVLVFMLEHGSARGETIARSLVPTPPPTEPEVRELALSVAVALFAGSHNGFEVVWPAIEADVDFGRSLVGRLAHRHEYQRAALALLEESELADLYTWVTRQFPYSEDPDRLESGFIGERESIADWRDSLLRQLEARGTPGANDALRRIAETFPELSWLRRVLAQAERRVRAETWVRPSPGQLVALAADSNRRFVAGGEQLLDVVVESLNRAQGRLTGETPQASLLWNNLPGGAARPKEEAELSDWLKNHLQDDLASRRVIVNREVEIRRAPGAGIGERTDIHIDAIGRVEGGEESHIRAVVEVKGCWHAELESALRTQLVNSYLLGTGNSFGIYVIGWFSGDRWDERDGRRSRCARHLRSTTEEGLLSEARALEAQHQLALRVVGLDVPHGNRR
jgi:hypothetical protein